LVRAVVRDAKGQIVPISRKKIPAFR